MEPHPRHKLLHAIVIILLLAAAAGVVLGWHELRDHDDNNQPASQQNESAGSISASRRACGIFTLAEAKQVLGESAKGGGNQLGASSSDIDTSTCNYSQDLSSSNVPVSGDKNASLTVKIPKTDDGISSNQKQFASLVPSDTESVPGYGEQAYWDKTTGQLNILKNNVWYSLRLGSADPASHNLEDTKQLADILINKM